MTLSAGRPIASASRSMLLVSMMFCAPRAPPKRSISCCTHQHLHARKPKHTMESAVVSGPSQCMVQATSCWKPLTGRKHAWPWTADGKKYSQGGMYANLVA